MPKPVLQTRHVGYAPDLRHPLAPREVVYQCDEPKGRSYFTDPGLPSRRTFWNHWLFGVALYLFLSVGGTVIILRAFGVI